MEIGPLTSESDIMHLNPDEDVSRLIVPAVVGVSGRVTDENGTAFPGVNVVVKGTTTGTVTDTDGKYTIDVPDDKSILVFSFVGYTVQEVSVEGRTVIDLMIAPLAALAP